MIRRANIRLDALPGGADTRQMRPAIEAANAAADLSSLSELFAVPEPRDLADSFASANRML
jgi:hypothetical protein